MRSGLKAAVLLSGVLLATPSLAARPPRVLAPGATETAAAIETLKQDPNLKIQSKTTKSLHWKDSKKPPPKKARTSGWLDALGSLFADSARLIFWITGSLLVAFALVWVLRVIRRRTPRVRSADAPSVPSHVQNLDVRPASLPADIAGAAAALLATGQIREALSLLYRGALSRAIHRHGIAIAESSTEGEVLSTVAPRLAPPGAQYFGRLVPLWQRAVYGAEMPANEAVADLCRDFAVLEASAA